ncbi:GNAT family N-acetyltransferase [Streptomyces sp. NPDC006692]|uniref:GNAT family N-acetyltransferase n=1 Tax=Streptomyces sp. NPDC006692 TaxID=3364758 RepID=UPI0036790BC7
MASDLILTLADESALPALTSLYDAAARWMLDNGIDQWQPGGKDAEHFRLRMKEGEVWLARTGRGAVVGAYELWWQDEAAWGARGPEAGYVHRLMVDRTEAPRGTGQALLAHAERRIAESGRALCRLDCRSDNERLRGYYEGAGYAKVGEQPAKTDGGGSPYAVTLMEKAVALR